MTKPRTKQEKKLQTVAEADLRSGLEIFTAISTVMRIWRPLAAAMEAGSGSKGARAAKGLARAQQACGDAVYRHLRGLPICVTVQAAKKGVLGRQSGSKEEVEAGVKRLWPDVDLEALLRASPPYLEQGQKIPPKGQWENGYDALSVAHAVRDHAVVAGLRKLAVAA